MVAATLTRSNRPLSQHQAALANQPGRGGTPRLEAGLGCLRRQPARLSPREAAEVQADRCQSGNPGRRHPLNPDPWGTCSTMQLVPQGLMSGLHRTLCRAHGCCQCCMCLQGLEAAGVHVSACNFRLRVLCCGYGYAANEFNGAQHIGCAITCSIPGRARNYSIKVCMLGNITAVVSQLCAHCL
jgi:hypothetical protein